MCVGNKSVAGDGTINEATFLENCKADVFTTATVDEGAPLKGANSFTEGQAKQTDDRRDGSVKIGISKSRSTNLLNRMNHL